MLRILVAIVCISIMQGCAVCTYPQCIDAVFCDRITLDGDPSDWQGITFHDVTPQNGVMDMERPSTAVSSTADLHFRFAVCHDFQALYVCVEVWDDVLMVDNCQPLQRSAKVFEDDGMEIFIDGDHSRSSDARDASGREYRSGGEFSMAANGASTSLCSGWPKRLGDPRYWQAVVRQEDDSAVPVHLIYEFRFNAQVTGMPLYLGRKIGFTVAALDDDDGDRRDHALYWHGHSPHCWKDESGWGILRIVDK